MSRSKFQWSDLRVGILTTVAVLVLVGIVLKVGTNEKLFASKYTLRTFVANVQNLSEGALVSLSGLKVGAVSRLELATFQGQNGVMIWLEVDSAFRDKITSSSEAHILTLGILGDKYVDITQGEAGEKPLEDGDFLKGVMPVGFGELADQATATLENLNAILVSGKSITRKIDQGEGFLGALLNDPKFSNEMTHLVSSLSNLLTAVESNQGSLGLLLNDSTVYENLVSFTGDLSELAGMMRAGEGSIGKIIANPDLYTNLQSLTARADSLVYKMANDGTTGRFFSDDQIYEDMSELLNAMQSLLNDVKTHPRKYINVKVF